MIINTKENLEKLESYLNELKDKNVDIVDLIKFISNNYGMNYECDINQERLKNVIEWSKLYNKEVYEFVNSDLDYSQKVFALERDGAKKIRIDIMLFENL